MLQFALPGETLIISCRDISISLVRAVETAHTDLTNLDFTCAISIPETSQSLLLTKITGLQVNMCMLAFSEPCVGILGTCLVLMRPVFLRCHKILSNALSKTNRNSRPRFPVTVTEKSRRTAEESQKTTFSVPIFIRTREVFSSVSQSVKTGLSGATVAFSPRQMGGETFEDWELAPGRDGRRPSHKSHDMLTHPWRMDTFQTVTKPPVMVQTSQKSQAYATDKPLPPLPDEDVSSLSESDADRKSVRGFG